jgi:nitrous oxidase accessory protein
MKKHSLTLVVLLLLSLVLVCFPQVKVAKAEPKTIVVPDDYVSIQEAIDNALEGDTIYVKKGIYHENLGINKSLSLIGEGKSETLIVGDSELNETAVFVYHDRVTIKNFTVEISSGPELSGGGVRLFNVQYCNVSNCDFMIIGLGIMHFNGYGVWLFGSSNNTVKDNQIDCTNIHNSYGIRLQDSPGNSIVENTITKNNYGIVLDNSIGNNLTENHVLDNFIGINVVSSNNNSIIRSNITNNFRGLDFTASKNNNVSGNHIANNNDGIALENMYNKFIENTITNNSNYGIYLYGAGYNNIIGNNITNNGRGISVSICYNNTFYNNNFVNNINHIETDGSNDKWDNGFEGNYWSNYNGTDNDGDGIGDSPYIINENNQDNYPLMEPTIIPEFPSWIILHILVIVTLFVIIFKKKLFCSIRD